VQTNNEPQLKGGLANTNSDGLTVATVESTSTGAAGGVASSSAAANNNVNADSKDKNGDIDHSGVPNLLYYK
jgi:hypothetical protein